MHILSRHGVAIALALLVGTLPYWIRGEYALYIATQFGVYVIVVMGLNVLAGFGGQISLGHGAFVGLGAYTAALTMINWGWSFWSAAAAAIVVSSIVGGLMALPALRVSTWYLALITLTFGQLFERLTVEFSWLTNGFTGLANIQRPRVLGRALSDVELYWLIAAIALAIALIVRNLAGSRLGRGLLAIRDNPEAAISSGVSIVGLKLFAFVFSAALAGLGGALFAVQKTVITPDDFTVDFSIFFLLVMVLGGSGRLWGPLVGMFAFFIVPELLTGLQSWRMIIYGFVLLALMTFAPNGLVGAIDAGFRRFVARAGWPRWAGGKQDLLVGMTGKSAPPDRIEGEPIVINNIRKAFGGLVALDNVSLHVALGETHAIVGPNGSGKTTLLNLISGFHKSDSGSMTSGDTNLLALAPHQVARFGIGRTFQTPKLLNGVSVLENVMLGAFGTERSTISELLLQLPRARAEIEKFRAIAFRALEFVGVQDDAFNLAGEIPHGRQRLVEIARAMAGSPRLLLLDEPAAGLSLGELAALERLILAIQTLGITVVIVEHHLDLVSRASRTVTVLNRGAVLAEGTPDEVFSNPDVLAAYMGRQPVEKVAAQ